MATRTAGFKVLRLDEICDSYHIKKCFDEYGNSLDGFSLSALDPYRVECVSYAGRKTTYVSCGFDFFGSRLYELDDVNY